MSATDIYNYFGGYVTVSISGRQPERFINLCMQKNIYIWNLNRLGDKIEFNISKKAFFLIRHIAFRTGIRVRILKKNGFFLLLRKLKKRKLLISVFLVFFILINILSSFVLKIEILNETDIPEEKIIAKLSEIDLKKFSLRSNIDVKEISIALRNGFDSVAWVGVYEKGTRVVIDIKGRVKPPAIVEKNIPCNLVAKRDGIVKSLTAENGEKSVAPGQMVKKGQVLISGVLPIKNSEEKRYVHSMGSVMADTEYKKETEFKLYTYEKEYTGNTGKTVSFSAFGKKLKKEAPSPYFNSDTETSRAVAGMFEFTLSTYKEYTLKKTKLEKEAAEENIKKETAKEFEKELGKDIIKDISFEITYKDSETGLLKAVAVCTEEIAEEKEIELCPNESSVRNQKKE